MSSFASIARSTSLRRASALSGWWKGSYTDGACGRPARSAACAIVNRFADVEKNVCAAASAPYAWRP
jgi:hypothetical protein